ncbi:hypothetical protein NHJ13734_000910 [Beauveria thailandica]
MTTLGVIPEIGEAPNLPEVIADWNKWIEENHHRKSSLESIGPRSGSETTVPQFYMLRTLYIKPHSGDRLEKDLSIDDSAARLALENSPTWKDYRDCFILGTEPQGFFGPAKLYQDRCAPPGMGNETTNRAFYLYDPKTPSDSQGSDTRASRSDRNFDCISRADLSASSRGSVFEYDRIARSQGVEDEELVNFALVLFGNALKSVTPSVKGNWWPSRSAFNVKIDNRQLYSALVDGVFRVEEVSKEQAAEQRERCQQLRGTSSTENSDLLRTTAIMEVKRRSRSNTKNWAYEIFYQEAAEMAAWIAEVPMLLDQKPDQDGIFRRILLSQDQREIYVTIASYTEKYISYILHSLDRPAYDLIRTFLTPAHFLTMRPYGPFRVDRLAEMEQLARILISLSYQNFMI